MQFRSTFSIPESEFKINHQQKIVTIGSCFSDEIGQRLLLHKFNGLINPFGVIFNSVSIEKLVHRSIHKKYFTKLDVHHNGEQFFCFDVHSSFNATVDTVVLERINHTIDEVNQYLVNADVLMITLGTSWVYNLLETDQVVANCHKVAAKSFQKKLLSTDENLKALKKIIYDLNQFNPKLKIIFTISPVRHIKDGFAANNVSKARLIDSVYQITQNSNQTLYFPSYELVMDDLRDYRFYKEDLIHPTVQAVEYIWEKFCETFFDKKTSTINQKINKINSALQHRPFNEETTNHQKFLKKLLVLMDEVEKGISTDFEAEKQVIISKLKPC